MSSCVFNAEPPSAHRTGGFFAAFRSFLLSFFSEYYPAVLEKGEGDRGHGAPAHQSRRGTPDYPPRTSRTPAARARDQYGLARFCARGPWHHLTPSWQRGRTSPEKRSNDLQLNSEVVDNTLGDWSDAPAAVTQL